MDITTIRAIISIVVRTVFMLVSGIIAIYTFANDLKGTYPDHLPAQHLKEYFSMFTGIIGIIIGYYFGKSDSQQISKSKTTDNKR